MKKLKNKFKFSAILLVLAMILSFCPAMIAQAATKDLKIISKTEVTAKQAKEWAKSKGATSEFSDLAELYFKYSSDCGDVNPALAFVQAAKETGYGKFGGVLDASYHNPCGLKIEAGGDDSDSNAHVKFDSWKEGVQAHMDHLALYAGASGYPKSDSYDQRQFKTIKGTAKTVGDLGGKWAPSTSYGTEVAALYDELLSYSGIKVEGSAATAPGTPEVKPNAPNVIKLSAITTDNSTNISSSIGWKNVNGTWYYYKSDNTKATGWIKPDSNWYYLKSDGSMATGWINDGSWYYLKDSGAMAKGWVQTGGAWYYLKNDGSMATGLNNIDDKIYLLNTSGSMKTGWSYIGDRWYYFSPDGSMAKGWIKDGNLSYYLYDTGAMAKGWINIDNTWYFLKDSGEVAKGWITSGGNSYYLESSTGRMLTDTTIDGRKIGADGKAEVADSNSNTTSKDNVAQKDSNLNNGKKTIVIDPGHNARGDYGCESTFNGIKYIETDLDMQVGVKLKAALEAKGFNVVMTREDGVKEYLEETESLEKRVNIANATDGVLYISIHHNAFDTENAYGVETYYSVADKSEQYGSTKLDPVRMAQSKKMAELINQAVVNATGAYNRGAKSDENRNLFVLRNTNMAAVLVEMGFLTNENEAKRCADSESQQKVANAIADVVAQNYK